MSRRLSCVAKRRRTLALRIAEIERMEARSTVTPVGLAALSTGAAPVAAQLGVLRATGDGNAPLNSPATVGAMNGGTASVPPPAQTIDSQSLSIVPRQASAGGGAVPDGSQVGGAQPIRRAGGEDPMAFIPSLGISRDQAGTTSGLSARWKPASRPGGGAALPPRGGSGSGASSSTAAAIQGRSVRPQSPGTPAAPPTIPGVLSGPTSPGTTTTSLPGTAVTRNAHAQRLQTGSGATAAAGTLFSPSSVASMGSTINENGSSLPYSGSGAQFLSFPYFPLYTLDYIQGGVLFNGGYQVGIPNGNVDLRAHVKNGTGVTFSWNTSGLTNAYNISGASTYDLTFTWEASLSSPVTDSVTLTATDTSNHQETQTYYFVVGIGTNTYPVLLQPEMERRPTRVILQLGRSLTMRKPRKNYTPVEKVAILRRHLIDHVPVSDLCDEHQLSPTLFYLWQKQFFENGPAAFQRKDSASDGHLQRTIAALRDKLQRKNEVVAELMEEHIKLKKELGDL